jgi:hypothetical protein
VAADNAFHRLIARASTNIYLQSAVETVRAQMFLPIGAVFERLEDNANDYHEEIVAAIRAKDGDAAEDAMRRHILSTRDRLHASSGARPEIPPPTIDRDGRRAPGRPGSMPVPIGTGSRLKPGRSPHTRYCVSRSCVARRPTAGRE